MSDWFECDYDELSWWCHQDLQEQEMFLEESEIVEDKEVVL